MRVGTLRTAAISLATVVALAAGAALGDGAPLRTERVRWSPFTADGTLRTTLRLAVAHDGECWIGSFVVHNAYRCASGHLIRDPCFSDPASSSEDPTVLCVHSPFERTAVRMHVSGRMSRAYSVKRGGLPWAMRLHSGRRCVFLQGATTVVGGRRANYGCGGNVILFGSPDRRRALWRIHQGRGFNAAAMRRVAIRSVYHGEG